MYTCRCQTVWTTMWPNKPHKCKISSELQGCVRDKRLGQPSYPWACSLSAMILFKCQG